MYKYTNILLFGGTFDPIHNGHLIMAQEAYKRLDIDKVIFIPSAFPPHKDNHIDFAHRFEMTKLAIEGIGYFEVSDIESKKDEPSYTINTVRHFFKEPIVNEEHTCLRWLIGSDTIPELKNWYKINELINECHFVIAERKTSQKENHVILCKKALKDIGIEKDYFTLHFTFFPNPIIEISSIMIREKIKNDNPIKFLVPEKVEKYIYDNELYKNK